MKEIFKKLSTAVGVAMASFPASANDGSTIDPRVEKLLDHFGDIKHDTIKLVDSVPEFLAAHRSHGSHSSHGSHRSSSGSGSGISRPSAPRTPVIPSTPPKLKVMPRSDPLGQKPKPADTFQPAIPDATELRSNKELRRRVIERVQLQLLTRGLYQGNIDGIMGPLTRDAIDLFKIKNGLKRGGYLDEATLNALGISIH